MPPMSSDDAPQSVPVPDPTALTTEQLMREIGALKATLESQIAHNAQVIELKTDSITRRAEALLEEMDKRADQLAAYVANEFKCERDVTEQKFANVHTSLADRMVVWGAFPQQIDEKVRHLYEMTDEKFDSVAQQFRERDTRSERESRDNKVAVDAAFAAQKEAASEQNKSNTLAIAKSEAATAETITKLSQLSDRSISALAQQITDLKERIDRAEGGALGGAAAASETYRGRNMMATAIGAIVGLLGIGLAIAVAVASSG